MIKKIINLNKEELYQWLKFDAGVNNGKHFGAYEGGLELQQVPEEYVEYLWFLKTINLKSYLNVGIGNGGSFMVESYIQSNCKRCVAVDNTSYGKFTNINNINARLTWLKENTDKSIEFFNMNSSDFFKSNTEKFDIIFIDGDHTYNGVKQDYENALNFINNGGYIIFHDIGSAQCEGVVRIWNEIKNENSKEFIFSTVCGIGIIQII
jgi:predicted O-methyltransferase YrrM